MSNLFQLLSRVGPTGVALIPGAPGPSGAAGPPGGLAFTIVNVTPSMSPYAAAAGQTLVCDTTTGSIVITLPTLTSGQPVTIKHASSQASLAAHSITISPPGGVALEQSPPNNGTTGASYVITGAGAAGTAVTFVNAGIANVYSIF